MKYFIANWKANKTKKEADQWMDVFFTAIQNNPTLKNSLAEDFIRIILCPPFHLLYPIFEKINGRKNIYLGSQDISAFGKGSFTGEVPAELLTGIVQYVLVGHSERRNHLHETDAILSEKVKQAKEAGIEPVFCIRGAADPIPEGVNIIAYEPVSAIGTGQYESLTAVLQTKQSLKFPPGNIFLYGGSVNEENASSYLSSEEISGLLVGTASLDSLQFLKIIHAI